MRMKRIISAAAALSILMSPGAYGHVSSERDPDDVSGRLDLKRIALDHDGSTYTFKLKMHESWSGKVIKGINGGINVYIDSAGDDRLNYYLVISKKRDRLKCEMYNRKGAKKADGRARKLAGDTVSCEVAAGRINRDRRAFRWAAQTSWRLSPDNYTYDYAPNEGYQTHKLPL